MRLLCSSALLVVLASACGQTAPARSPAVRATDYDRACATDDDCQLIHTGNPCGEGYGVCDGDAAIAKREHARYVRDLEALRPCTEVVPPVLTACMRRNSAPICTQGTCAVRYIDVERDAGATAS